MRGSVVGTRLDLQESLEFAEAGKVKATVAKEKLENINDVFAQMDRVRSKDLSFLICTGDYIQWLARQAG